MKYTFSEAELCSRLGGLVWFDAYTFNKMISTQNQTWLGVRLLSDNIDYSEGSPDYIYGFIVEDTPSNSDDIRNLRDSTSFVDLNLGIIYVLLNGTFDEYVIEK